MARNYYYNQERRFYNPIRIVQCLLCAICLAITIDLIIHITSIISTLKIVLLLACICFLFITLIDIIVTTLLKPMLWTTWIAMAFMGFLSFSLCVGLLISQFYIYRNKILFIFAIIIFSITALVFLLDLLHILMWLMRNKPQLFDTESIKTSECSDTSVSPPPKSPVPEILIVGTNICAMSPCSQICKPDLQKPEAVKEKVLCQRESCPKRVFSSIAPPSHGGTFHVSRDVTPILNSSICSNNCYHDVQKPSNTILKRDVGTEVPAKSSRTVSTSVRTVPKQQQSEQTSTCSDSEVCKFKNQDKYCGSSEQTLKSAEQLPESAEQMPESAEQTSESAEQMPESAEQTPESAEETPESVLIHPNHNQRVKHYCNCFCSRCGVIHQHTATIAPIISTNNCCGCQSSSKLQANVNETSPENRYHSGKCCSQKLATLEESAAENPLENYYATQKEYKLNKKNIESSHINLATVKSDELVPHIHDDQDNMGSQTSIKQKRSEIVQTNPFTSTSEEILTSNHSLVLQCKCVKDVFVDYTVQNFELGDNSNIPTRSDLHLTPDVVIKKTTEVQMNTDCDADDKDVLPGATSEYKSKLCGENSLPPTCCGPININYPASVTFEYVQRKKCQCDFLKEVRATQTKAICEGPPKTCQIL